MEPIARLSRDTVKASIHLGLEEIRYLVDSYYALQEYRKAAANQELALGKGDEPHEVVSWLRSQTEGIEGQIKRVLDRWTDDDPLSCAAKQVTGIGPVISAGLRAHIDITKAPTVGHIWRFAGLDPTMQWEKGQKRPWNASLKTLCWKIGESFVKVSGLESDFYGKVYLDRKQREDAKNTSGDFSSQAEDKLKRFKIGKDTKARGCYEQGLLPPAHIHSRAKRYAVKLFLAHYHHRAHEIIVGCPPPKPYIIEHGGHAHFIAPPPCWYED